ncbi:MAG TPA: tripartite tricarboxylate transporter substrate binding protein [Ramlibacter sp.]|nr:tripartite tricarboxylate transporter substrate binding protein [Ramlibacter sp.]
MTRDTTAGRTVRAFIRMLAAGLISATTLSAFAADGKLMKIVVPAPAGGAMDTLARLLAEQMGTDTGQPVIVENKPGAGGAIAVRTMMSAPADGQTIMVTASNVLTEIPHVMKAGFDPLTDIKPVAAVVRAMYVLVGSTSLPAQDFKSLLAYVKATPGVVSFASPSTGTSGHYSGMILNQKAGLDMQHVPFPGSPPALAQVMGGQIPLMFDGVVTSMPFIASGKLKTYAVTGKTRSVHLPQVPTFTELGYPSLDFTNWFGVVVASGVPAATVERLSAAVNKAGANPKVHAKLIALGFEPAETMTPAQLQQLVRTDFERNAGIVNAFNIQLNK